jgi:hypothetical protein
MERNMWLNQFIPLISMAIVFATLPGRTLATEATPATRATTLELPAMILTPTDLGFAGMAAYPIDHVEGVLQTPQDTADEAVYAGNIPEERATAVFVDSGLQQLYRHQYVLRYPNDPISPLHFARRVTTSVYEFADASAAKVAFDPLARLLAWDAPAINSGSPEVGDDSRLSRAEVPYEKIEGTYPQLTLTFRTGRLIASVSISDDKGEPNLDGVDTLTERLFERINSVESGGGPGLSDSVVRFSDLNVMSGNYDGYSLLGGNVVVRSGDSYEVFTPLEATAAAGAGALDGYKLSNYLVADQGAWVADLGSLVYRFPDTFSSSAWIEALPTRLAITDARKLKVTEEPTFGDEAFTATYLLATSSDDQHRQITAMQVGAYVAILYGPEMEPEMTEALMSAQAACLDPNGCPLAV